MLAVTASSWSWSVAGLTSSTCGRIKVTGSVGGDWPCQGEQCCINVVRISVSATVPGLHAAAGSFAAGAGRGDDEAWPLDRCAGTRSGAHRNSLRDSWDPQRSRQKKMSQREEFIRLLLLPRTKKNLSF
jgi:hypothetical protein